MESGNQIKIESSHTPEQRAEIILAVLGIQGNYQALMTHHKNLTDIIRAYGKADTTQEVVEKVGENLDE